jgi:hypothetical protein
VDRFVLGTIVRLLGGLAGSLGFQPFHGAHLSMTVDTQAIHGVNVRLDRLHLGAI